MKGLIIKPKWATLILSGHKTWEIRGTETSHRGPTAIIKSGSGKIFGMVDIVDCIPLHGPHSAGLIQAITSKHRVSPGNIEYRRPWAWVLQNARMLPEPIPYQHPQGAVIWVKLPDDLLTAPTPSTHP
ncbi:ASCH domain-containing protein [Cohnella sp. GCM10020058]|uniref:ASCH domain-containing protein n=1 Tax=Cohnella sp. GCM10020058 TaxID=3317330 RepID=UPI00362B95C9